MKRITTFFGLIIFIILISCQNKVPVRHTLADIETAFQKGLLSKASQWADSVLKEGKTDSLTAAMVCWPSAMRPCG